VTAQARELASRLAGEPEVRSLRFDDSTLILQTSSPGPFYEKLTRLLARESFGVRELTSPDDNLEAVFKYLTEP
jgi:ABC-2 type transport system ATP-binding protein